MTAPLEGRCPALRFRTRNRRVLGTWVAGQAAQAAYAARVGDILAAAQAGNPTAVFDGRGEFTGLALAPGELPPPGWRRAGELYVPDPSLAAGRWVTAAIALAGYPGDPRQGLPGLPAALVQDEVPPGWHAELTGDGTALDVSWLPAVRSCAGLKNGGRLHAEADLRLWEPLAVEPGQPAAAAGGDRR